jgi:hypothetical protein
MKPRKTLYNEEAHQTTDLMQSQNISEKPYIIQSEELKTDRHERIVPRENPAQKPTQRRNTENAEENHKTID